MAIATITGDYVGLGKLYTSGTYVKTEQVTPFSIGGRDLSPGGHNIRAVARFPLGVIPKNADITKVELLFYNPDNLNATPNWRVEAHQYFDNSSDTATDDDALAIYTRANDAPTYATSTQRTTAGAFTLEIGANSAAQACIDLEARLNDTNPHYQVGLKSTYEVYPNAYAPPFNLNGPSAGNNPLQIRVTYTSPPNTPGVSEPDINENVFNTRPTFEFQYSHPDGTAGDRYEVEVYADTATDAVPGSPVYDSTEVTLAMTSGFPYYHRPSSGTFTAGTWYRWRARTRASGTSLWSNWSSLTAGRFRRTSGPQTPSGLTPTGGTVISDTTPTLISTYLHGESEALSDMMVEVMNDDTEALHTGYPKWTALACDDFDRADGAPGTTPAANGTGGAWTTLAGTVTIASNKLTASSQPALAHLGDTGQSSVEIFGRFDVPSSGSGSVGIAFLIVDASNYWRFRLRGDGLATLERVVAGSVTWSVDLPLMGDNANNPVHARIKCGGGQITLQLDHYGPGGLTYADTTHQSATKHGLYFSSTTAACVDFAVVRGDGASAVTQHTVSPALTNGVNYKWRTKHRDGHQFSSLTSYALFAVAAAPVVTLTAPADAAVLSTPMPQVTWAYSGGTQGKYRVEVRASDDATLVYDSGYLNGTNLSFVIPTGYLENGQTYKVRVYAVSTLGLEGVSAVSTITTAWVVPLTVLTFTANENPAYAGACDFVWTIERVSTTCTSSTSTTLVKTAAGWTVDTYINHRVRITSGAGAGQIRKIIDNDATSITIDTPWSTNPSGGDSFVIDVVDLDFWAWDIIMVDDQGVEQRIARITDPTALAYTYFFTPLNRTVTFYLRQVRRLGSEEITDGTGKAVNEVVTGSYFWITEVGDPSYKYLAIAYNLDRTVSADSDSEKLQFWGRELPVEQHGIARQRQFSIRGVVPTVSDTIPIAGQLNLAYLDYNIQTKRLLCVRDPRSRKMFAYLNNYRISERGPGLSDVSLVFDEVEYDESENVL